MMDARLLVSLSEADEDEDDDDDERLSLFSTMLVLLMMEDLRGAEERFLNRMTPLEVRKDSDWARSRGKGKPE